MNNLKYRRQFLFIPVECGQLEGWQIEKVDDYFIYVHPDCQFEKSSGFYDLYLIGYILNPHAPGETSKQILDNLSRMKDMNDFPEKLYSLTGRFVLIIKTEDDFIFFNDEKDITPEFAEIYKANSDMAHINDWGKITYGMLKTFPQEKVAVKGSCSEVGRCYWYPDGKHKAHLTDEDLLLMENGWYKLNFIRDAIRKWHESIKENSFNSIVR